MPSMGTPVDHVITIPKPAFVPLLFPRLIMEAPALSPDPKDRKRKNEKIDI